MSKHCCYCRFYSAANNNETNNGFNGYCKRYPRMPTSNGFYMPEVYEKDWCGEWKPKEDFTIEPEICGRNHNDGFSDR